MFAFNAKQFSLAATWLSAALKIAGYSGAAEVIDFAGKSAGTAHEVWPPEYAPVAEIVSRVQRDIESATRQALTAEFGPNWERRVDLAAPIAALPDVLARCMPDATQITAANFDPNDITEVVLKNALAIDRELFGPNSLGQTMLRQITLQSYIKAQQNKDFAINLLLHGLREILDRIDNSHKTQERIEQLLQQVSRSTEPEATRMLVKAVTTELVPMLTRELLPYMSDRNKDSLAIVSGGIDPTAELRETHARWVQATLSLDSVRSFFAMGSAIAHELRISQRNLSSRVLCLDASLICWYLDPSDHFTPIDQLTTLYFMEKGDDAGQMALTSCSAFEVESFLAYLTTPSRRQWNYQRLAQFGRIERFLNDRRLSLLSEILGPNELGAIDEARIEVIFSALSHQSKRFIHKAGRNNAHQLEQIERTNRALEHDHSYASLLATDVTAARFRTAITSISNKSQSAEYIQSVWGPAWKCFVGWEIGGAVIHAFEHLISNVMLAERYLQSFGHPDKELQRLSRSELETLRAALVHFGHSTEPFFEALVNHFNEQRRIAAEEARLWVADLLSGGQRLEQLIAKCISLASTIHQGE